MAVLPYYYFGSRNLRLSSPYLKGTDIRILQQLLNFLPENIVKTRLLMDGVYGANTRRAVREFQEYFNLIVDGIVGQESYYRLGHRIGKYAVNEPVFSSRVLKNGLQGEDVKVLQNRLAAFRKPYLNQPADGKYRFFTESAVAFFQDGFPDLDVNGVAGPDTYNYIFTWAPLGGRRLRLAVNGLDTYWLQLYLYQLGYYHHPADGFFNYETEEALRSFQADANIASDGIAGPQTFLALGSSIPFPRSPYFYRVQPGDSLFRIAMLFAKNMDEISNLNNISPPDYVIYVGQMLKIPVHLTFHLIEKGDTLESLAQKYDIPLNDLKRANSLFPDSYLLPDETVVLPGFNESISGYMLFLDESAGEFALKKTALKTLDTEVLGVFGDLGIPRIFLNKGQYIASMLGNNGKEIINYDLRTAGIDTLPLPLSADYLDWSYDNQKIVVDDGLVIEAENGEAVFFITGKTPQWLTVKDRLIFYTEDSAFKTVDIVTGEEKLLFKFEDDAIWYFQFSNEKSALLFFAFITPGRVTITYLYKIEGELQELSRNDFFGAWSAKSNIILLKARDYYGTFFPWFYQNVRLYDENGVLSSEELYAKAVDLNAGNFSGDESSYLAVLYQPDTFYPLSMRNRDIYIKKTATRLLTQITQGLRAFSPVWLDDLPSPLVLPD